MASLSEQALVLATEKQEEQSRCVYMTLYIVHVHVCFRSFYISCYIHEQVLGFPVHVHVAKKHLKAIIGTGHSRLKVRNRALDGRISLGFNFGIAYKDVNFQYLHVHVRVGLADGPANCPILFPAD